LIPKRIVQIYVGPESDELDYFKHLARGWQEAYPHWEHLLLRDSEVEEHVKGYSSDAWEVYSKIDLMTYRADLARLIILYRLGGLYIDLDTRPNLDLDTYVIRSPDMHWGFCFTNGDLKNERHSGFRCHNHLIASEKESPFLKRIIDNMLVLAKQTLLSLNRHDQEMRDGMWIAYIVSVEGLADQIVSSFPDFEESGQTFETWLTNTGYPMVGWQWIWQDANKIKINKERSFVTHIGSIILKDMPDTTPPSQNILVALADLYKDIPLKSGNIKIVSKGQDNGI